MATTPSARKPRPPSLACGRCGFVALARTEGSAVRAVAAHVIAVHLIDVSALMTTGGKTVVMAPAAKEESWV